MLNIQQIQKIYTPEHGMEVKGRGKKQHRDPAKTRAKIIKLRDSGFSYKQVGGMVGLTPARCNAVYLKYKKEHC